MYTGDRWQSPMKSSMELVAEFPARAKDRNRGKSAKKRNIPVGPQFRRMATQKMANCWRSPLFPFGKWFLDLAFFNKWQSTNGQLLEML